MSFSLGRLLHRGLDDAAVEAHRLIPLRPPRLATGPLLGNPTELLGGIPNVAPLPLRLSARPTHVDVSTPVPGTSAPNHRLHLHIYPPAGISRGAVVLCPFWMIPSPLALAPYIRLVNAQGLHAVVYVPPDHMERTPPGYFTGERMLGWDFPHLERMVQLVASELWAVTAGLKRLGRPVYLMGFSLGGLYAAVGAVAGAPVDGLAMVTPALDVQAAMTSTTLGRRYQKLLMDRGDCVPDAALMTQLSEPYLPASYPRPLAAERIFLAHGRHDGVVPLDSVTTLAQRWDVAVNTYTAGHMSLLFLQRRPRQDLSATLQRWQAMGPAHRSLPAAAAA